MFCFDKDRKILTLEGKDISLVDLSSSELLLVEVLSTAYPHPVSRSDLLATAWSNRVVSENSLNVAVNNIRNNFSRQVARGDELLLTERGFGYRFDGKLLLENSINFESTTLDANDSQVNTCESKSKNEKFKSFFSFFLQNKKSKVVLYILFLINLSLLCFIYFAINLCVKALSL